MIFYWIWLLMATYTLYWLHSKAIHFVSRIKQGLHTNKRPDSAVYNAILGLSCTLSSAYNVSAVRMFLQQSLCTSCSPSEACLASFFICCLFFHSIFSLCNLRDSLYFLALSSINQQYSSSGSVSLLNQFLVWISCVFALLQLQNILWILMKSAVGLQNVFLVPN